MPNLPNFGQGEVKIKFRLGIKYTITIVLSDSTPVRHEQPRKHFTFTFYILLIPFLRPRLMQIVKIEHSSGQIFLSTHVQSSAS